MMALYRFPSPTDDLSRMNLGKNTVFLSTTSLFIVLFYQPNYKNARILSLNAMHEEFLCSHSRYSSPLSSSALSYTAISINPSH
jgi:hypothetical protein